MLHRRGKIDWRNHQNNRKEITEIASNFLKTYNRQVHERGNPIKQKQSPTSQITENALRVIIIRIRLTLCLNKEPQFPKPNLHLHVIDAQLQASGRKKRKIIAIPIIKCPTHRALRALLLPIIKRNKRTFPLEFHQLDSHQNTIVPSVHLHHPCHEHL